MRITKRRFFWVTAGIGALTAAIPVMGQGSPESLLPPGFSDPAPSPAPAPAPTPSPTPAPTPSQTPSSPSPSAPVSSGPGQSAPSSDSAQSSSAGSAAGLEGLDLPTSLLDLDEDSDLSALDDLLQPKYSMAPGQRRSLDRIGVLAESAGGIGPDGFGGEGGNYLTRLIRNLNGPIISRWGSILLRRVLLSRVDTPANVNPADWVAERAWRLLLMGDADAARALVLKVDVGNYSPRLYEVAMQAHLATADPAGICPFVPSGKSVSEAPTWVMFGPICASFSGEQSRATSLLERARRDKVATGIDYLLAEKTVGAGFDGRRAVTIDWDDIQYFNAWRFGLGVATGVEPPDRLYVQAGRHVQGWRARAPMLSKDSRMKASSIAAAIGVLSNRSMVGLYSDIYTDPEGGDDWKAQASTLRQAYTSVVASDRIEAMQALWDRSDGMLSSYAGKILTARAAARIRPSSNHADVSADLIGSMLTAGLDRNAAAWRDVVVAGSPAWGLITVGAPDPVSAVSYDQLDDFGDDDDSDEQLKSQFLLAALAGLNRLDAGPRNEFAADLDLDLTRSTKWTRAIESAAAREQVGTVSLLAAIGMQGRDWTAMSPLHLYHITRALKRVGLEAEARMIAAEALART